MPEQIRHPVRLALFGACLAAAPIFSATAEDARSLWTFAKGGYAPQAGLVVDSQGNLFGTTDIGGSRHCGGKPLGCGTVYELSPPTGSATNWTYTVLHAFHGDKGGGFPQTQLTIDSNGIIYGYTTYNPYGNVFRLLPPAQGQTGWTFQNLYTFTNPAKGSLAYTYAPLIVSSGRVYGIAGSGGRAGCGQYDCGTLFQLTPGKNGSPWTEQTLVRFSGHRAIGQPSWMVGPDSSGAFFISTYAGNGAVLRYVPGAKHASVVTSFRGGNDGSYPSSLVLGPDGTLYGVVGAKHGSEVFALSSPTGGNSKWQRSAIAKVNMGGGYGASSLALGPDGTLIGTIIGEIDFYPGNAFELIPPAGGRNSWTYKQLWSFTHGPDRNPLDIEIGRGKYASNIFGVLNGGDSTDGSIYELCKTECDGAY